MSGAAVGRTPNLDSKYCQHDFKDRFTNTRITKKINEMSNEALSFQNQLNYESAKQVTSVGAWQTEQRSRHLQFSKTQTDFEYNFTRNRESKSTFLSSGPHQQSKKTPLSTLIKEDTAKERKKMLKKQIQEQMESNTRAYQHKI